MEHEELPVMQVLKAAAERPLGWYCQKRLYNRAAQDWCQRASLLGNHVVAPTHEVDLSGKRSTGGDCTSVRELLHLQARCSLDILRRRLHFSRRPPRESLQPSACPCIPEQEFRALMTASRGSSWGCLSLYLACLLSLVLCTCVCFTF